MSVTCNLTPTQHLFLGLSVVSWSAEGGREQQTSTCTIQLVQDTTACNVKKYYNRKLELSEFSGPDPGFIFPRTGSPCYFRVDDFEFCGLLQRYEEGNSTNGNLWTVVLQSPNIILEKTSVILSDFIGVTSVVPNVINAYRAAESLFAADGVSCAGSPIGTMGGADVTEKGIPWLKIKPVLMGLTSSIVPMGGILDCLAFGRLTFKGNSDFINDYSSTEGYGLLFDDGTTQAGVGYCEYMLDLSELPDQWDGIPYSYRFTGTQDLMSLLTQVAEDCGSDLFIELIPARLTGDRIYKVIKIRRFRRNIDPAFVYTQPQAHFDTFVANMEALHGGKKVVTAKSAGRELAINEPTSVLLFGAPKEKIFVFDQTSTKRYWGEYSNGNMIVETTINPITFEDYTEDDLNDGIEPSFYVEVELGGLPLSLSHPELLDGYSTVKIYEDELLAAKFGFDAWSVWAQSFNAPDSFGSILSEKMHSVLKLDSVSDTLKLLYDDKGAMGFPADIFSGSFRPTDDGSKNFLHTTLSEDDINVDLDKIHAFINRYATEYYGKKYAIAIPATCVDFSEEGNTLRVSEQPVEAGWLENEEGLDGEYIQFGNQAERLSFPTLSFFQNEDGRIQCVGRVLSPNLYDGSQMTQEEYVYNVSTGMLNIKLSPNTDRYTFINATTFSGPHVIVELTTDIQEQQQEGDIEFALKLLEKVIAEAVRREPGPDPVDADVKETVTTLASKSNNQLLRRLGMYPRTLHPSHLQTALAFRSNITTYGPWWNYGVPGLTKVEHDSELAPWSVGSIENMNKLATYKINTSTAQTQSQDSGSISIVGTPKLTLGQELNFPITRNLDNRISSTASISQFSYLFVGDMPSDADFGPVLTSVSCEYGASGFTTKYDFRTYSPKYAKFAEENIERMRTFGSTRTKQNRLANMAILDKLRGSLLVALHNARINGKPPKTPIEEGAKTPSPHSILVGSTIPKGEDLSTSKTDVGLGKLTELQAEISSDYKNKAIMSLDGLVRPIQRGSVSDNLPSYANSNAITLGWTTREIEGPIKDKPILGNQNIDNTILDPILNEDDFKFHTGVTHHDISMFARGEDISSNISDRDQEIQNADGYVSQNGRYMALRGPVMIAGWGLDIDGKPIPNEADGDGVFRLDGLKDRFKQNWLEDSTTWPVGPLDVRFDRHRGVWTFPGGFKLMRVKLKEDLYDKAEGQILEGDGPTRYDAEGSKIDEKLIDIYNPFATEESISKSINDGGDDKLNKLANENDIILVYFNTHRHRYFFLNKIWSTGGGGGTGSQIYKFKLNQLWKPGEIAYATLYTADGEVNIELESVNTDHWGNADDYGHCYYDTLDEKYYCLTVNHPARVIRFETYQDRNTSVQTMDITNGIKDEMQGYTPNVTVVHDYGTGNNARWPLAKTGAIGYAVYDPDDQTYNIIECQQQAQWGIGKVNDEALCGGDATLSAFNIIRHGEMMQDINTNSAYNKFQHRGVKNDEVYVTYNPGGSLSLSNWTIIDITQKSASFIQDIYNSDEEGNNCLAQTSQIIGFESCSIPVEQGLTLGYIENMVTNIKTEDITDANGTTTRLIYEWKPIKVLCNNTDPPESHVIIGLTECES